MHIGYGGFIMDDGALRTVTDPRGLGFLVYKESRFGNCQIRIVFKAKEPKCNAAGTRAEAADGKVYSFAEP